jgi:hypothetical protein
MEHYQLLRADGPVPDGVLDDPERSGRQVVPKPFDQNGSHVLIALFLDFHGVLTSCCVMCW